MAASDDSSFYLYGVGEKPEALTLGSLVLEKYWQPLAARHYTHDLLSDEALQEHAYASDFANAVFRGASRRSPGVGLSGGDIVDLRLAYDKEFERIVTARKGRRIILKDPESFLLTSVLNNPQAQQKLKLWLSAARSSYLLNFKFARRPKIWLLTGLYILEGTRTLVSQSQSNQVSVGISSTVIGALSSVPVGGSVKLGQGTSWEVTMEVEDQHVWAAQFRLLDARFIKLDSKGLEDVTLPTSMGLYRDIMSVSRVRGGGRDVVDLQLLSGRDDEDNEDEQESNMGDDQDSHEMQEFEKRLEDTIRMFEKAPKHVLE
ncbi:uncharacterized protein BP01DRAFT_310204 [Aspergillus saccharolyticus JOP 1030-1]|uniref:Uncharacterized protein n=1 Tax=Aspergillus saccharolyticus JOP 1030-1 TaxID=1450539 RepID=A0A319AV90_9EURO|nr:hypothetical protein BP01DRAFT_310204 [Aspergillus saccharolyticus JOP 1030-1]PYH49982.1 hypothetical protein BP01DRAFT_310204 [Aspergillus saccharolyticus JOP 1030-1]